MVIDQLPVVNGRTLHPGSAQIMTSGFSVGPGLRACLFVPGRTAPASNSGARHRESSGIPTACECVPSLRLRSLGRPVAYAPRKDIKVLTRSGQIQLAVRSAFRLAQPDRATIS